MGAPPNSKGLETSELDSRLEQLKKALIADRELHPERHDHHALLRFLRARQGDVAAAQAMWAKSQAWRKLWGADHVLNETVLTEKESSRLQVLYPHGLHNVDAMGRPVLIYKIGATNIAGLRSEFKEDTLKRKHVQTYEFILQQILPGCSKEAGRHVEQITTVIDLQGMGLWDMAKVKELLLPTLSMNADNYPETLGALIIINAPMGFSSAFEALKSFMAPETQKKIQVLGKNYQTVLSKVIPKENLLSEYGGTSVGRLADNTGPWEKHFQRPLDSPDFTFDAPQSSMSGGESHLGLKTACSTSCLPPATQSAPADESLHKSTLPSCISSQDLGAACSLHASRPVSDSTPLSRQEHHPNEKPSNTKQPPKFNMLILQEDLNFHDDDPAEQFFTPSCVTPSPLPSAKGWDRRTPHAPWMSQPHPANAQPVGHRASASSILGPPYTSPAKQEIDDHRVTALPEEPEGQDFSDLGENHTKAHSTDRLWSWIKGRSWFSSQGAIYGDLLTPLSPNAPDGPRQSDAWGADPEPDLESNVPSAGRGEREQAEPSTPCGVSSGPSATSPDQGRAVCLDVAPRTYQHAQIHMLPAHSSPSRASFIVKSFSRQLRGRLTRSKSDCGPRASLLLHDEDSLEFEAREVQCCIVM